MNYSSAQFLRQTLPGNRSGDTVYAYRISLVGCTVKRNTTDIQRVDSVYSKTIHQEMEEDHKTKAARDEGVEKHSRQIEWRGAHVNLVYYNGKQVLRAYNMLHVTAFLYVRSKDEKSPIVGDERMHMGSTLFADDAMVGFTRAL
jgi:hypothetical protein